jgi:hypothetical protein
MMSRGRLKGLFVGGLAAVAAMSAYLKMYEWPREAKLDAIRRQEGTNASFETAIRDRTRVRAELSRFASQTIAARPDIAAERFRAALGDIATTCGLAAIEVNAAPPEASPNPAGSKVTSSIRAQLQKQVDFSVLRADLAGTGTLEQALTTLAMLRAQPWVHRVDGFSLKPEDKDRQRFSLRVGVATLILPDAPKDLPAPRIIPLDPEAATQWAGIVKKNVFREPPPMQVAIADQQPHLPEPPPAPPWGEWKLTGVIETRRRVEALMVNSKTKESTVLGVGSGVAGATFVSGSREAAVFEIGGQKFEVVIGQTLEQRSPVAR